ncbi:Putative DNA-binding domain protein [uncultured archaeon]|nr:Putative DNA-binding domain protein [uncultured archaeon]
MTPAELKARLYEMMTLPAETEWVEFKEAKNDHDFDDIGKYFSALSNEANLRGKPAGWLIFGVTDKFPRRICGTNYRLQKPGLDRLKEKITQHTNHQITFLECHEFFDIQGRVVLFEIPPAPRGIPTTWNGIPYGRIHDSLGPLSLQEIEQIRRQGTPEDWSAQICESATINDLDPQAIAFAKQEYKKKNPKLAAEVDRWDDTTFLNKSKVCIKGTITRTAIILLGRNESEHFLSPSVAGITWVLKDANGMEKDYEHFGPPLILAVDQVFAKIRNLTYRYLRNETLFPTEITQYESWVIREALHNAIAHQDYAQGGRINVIEESDSLLFTNLGEFLPGSVEEFIFRDAPPEHYRNQFLATAMVNLNMIDTIGSGIKRMFTIQRRRSFPMPEYDLSQHGSVKVRIIGKVVDEKYTRMLMMRTDLHLKDVIALDKVQKGKPLSKDEFKSLKNKHLIEGRRPNLFVSAEVAAATDTKADYIRKRAFNKNHYKKMIADYLEEFNEASRQDIDDLLFDKISDALTDAQKKTSITNLLQELRRDGVIKPLGTTRHAKWVMSK